MSVAVAVGAPVSVAALVNWNDIVKVIDAGGRFWKCSMPAIDRYRRRLPPRLRALITATASFPLTSAATLTGATTATATATPTAFRTGFDRPFLTLAAERSRSRSRW